MYTVVPWTTGSAARECAAIPDGKTTMTSGADTSWATARKVADRKAASDGIAAQIPTVFRRTLAS
jgi:hypothetical protein